MIIFLTCRCFPVDSVVEVVIMDDVRVAVVRVAVAVQQGSLGRRSVVESAN